MPQWGERRHTLEQLNRELPGLNHRSKIGLGRSMNADLRRPHTMAGMGTESDLNHRRVVPVLGAQFRSRPTSSGDDRSSMQGSASCPGCAALNSKLHKNHKQLAELAIKITGSPSKIVHLPLPGDDPKQRKPDITKVRDAPQAGSVACSL